ncbi:CWC27 (YPL064C) [Zygosaccharomyces parabailii]|uniref:ZYBA0S08-00364g1_1 n=1 Tax=Zygosaccharomyces bailii (strain CLIB 213 / ATCC 58445 / CBS 680 / BCRC 21525 / NBRC 1098 / NCYC 1416 / NRRL Y-2227) TaxID=1333698 RepID=A0A8J2T9G2_ZYGB2|nr:CWC27 (YPL064C) [Zygosaccharomyces parabailii]CDF90678.1 ZYBA0S08-00364g1_1 [Zygosaccharomyces bailii CLIB 213]CDH14154.1 uncharacterized protein ZBAI_05940 [Zygosaccharomyces bailii ISA1307]
MSREPSTSAKCILNTSKGRLDIELWAREVPAASKAFLQQCQDDVVSRLSKVRSDGTVTMGRIRYAHIEPEHHILIRDCKRGTVGWDGHTGEWFVATQDCPWNEKRTLIGKVVGQSNYVLRRIVDESELNQIGEFIYPPLVESVELTIPYFDLKPKIKQLQEKQLGRPRKIAKVKMSYESDEENDVVPLKKMRLPPGVGGNVADVQVDIQKEGEGELEGREEQEQEEKQRAEQKQDGEPQQAELESDQEGHNHQQEQDSPLELSQREKHTLSLLAQFQERTRGRNILSRQ